jgi:long-chain acyl-CoA synthetase
MPMNLFSVLEAAAKKWPDEIALVHDERSLSYLDLHSAAESLAQRMHSTGIRAGGKVGLMCPSGLECVVAFFALLRSGAVVIPVAPAMKAAEVANLAHEMALDAFCYTAPSQSVIPESRSRGWVAAPISAGRVPLRIQLTAERATPESEREKLRKIGAAVASFTSGTTATAKGVIFSHASLLQRAETFNRTFSLGRGDSILWLVSTQSLLTVVCAASLQPIKLVLADAMNVGNIPRLVRQQCVGRIHATPLFYRLIANEPDIAAEDLLGVEWFFSTGIALPKATSEVFHARFGREILQAFGLAETSTALVNFNEDAGKRGSIGTPGPDYRVRLDARDTGDDSLGELLIRGSGLFDAYYRPWRPRDEVLEDGWFRTGDIARRDHEGYYWIVGRAKEVINVGGVKVFPREVEEMLLLHPAVDEAMVFGAPEPRLGEAPRAKVKLVRGALCGEKELLQYVNQRLSVFKALRGVEFVDEIPKTVTGKPRRQPRTD